VKAPFGPDAADFVCSTFDHQVGSNLSKPTASVNIKAWGKKLEKQYRDPVEEATGPFRCSWWSGAIFDTTKD
jgi:hypothetical protein